jgi:Mg-chelatase subunit ChlD
LKQFIAKVPLVNLKQISQTLSSYFDQWKIKLSKKAPPRKTRQYAGKRAASLTTSTRGRPTSHEKPKAIPKENIALLPSIITSLVNRGKSEGKPKVKLHPTDLRIWVRQGRSPVTLVLIADASFSTYHFLPAVSKALLIVYRDAYRNRDRLGVIVFQKNSAQIMNHPTNNLRVALGNLARLTPSGFTPLADGLRKALQVFKHEKRRSPNFIPFAILISDCFPEPLTHKYVDLLEEPAYQETLKLSRDFRREKIPIVVINPAHGKTRSGTLYGGTKLGMKIAQISNGKYYGIPEKEVPSRTAPFAKYFHKRYTQREAKIISGFLDDARVDFLTIHGKGE